LYSGAHNFGGTMFNCPGTKWRTHPYLQTDRLHTKTTFRKQGQWKHISVTVGTATVYGLDSPGLIPSSAKFFSSQHSDQIWGPPSLLSNGHQVLSPSGLKQQGHETDRSPPFNAEVKKGGAIPPLPHVSMA
jgi:hypothetical protein